jgi:hypothetical protein
LQSYPEESIDRVQGWPRPFPFEDGDLLPESENFKGGVASTAEEHADGSEETEYAFQHELTVVTWRNVASIDNPAKAAGWLFLKLQEVLATDKGSLGHSQVRSPAAPGVARHGASLWQVASTGREWMLLALIRRKEAGEEQRIGSGLKVRKHVGGLSCETTFLGEVNYERGAGMKRQFSLGSQVFWCLNRPVRHSLLVTAVSI